MTTPIPEAEVQASLRAATADFDESWDQARFVAVDAAERRGRVIVAAARTVPWDAVPPGAGWLLKPYGVWQHTLIVGFEEAAPGLRVDVSLLRRRTW